MRSGGDVIIVGIIGISYGRIQSPYTGSADDNISCYIWITGALGNGGLYVDQYSYGNRRALAITMVHGAYGRVVVSTAITTSEIPTDFL